MSYNHFLYWDDEGNPQPDKTSGKISGTKVVKLKRWEKLYKEFQSLSTIEQDNFINLIKQTMTNG